MSVCIQVPANGALLNIVGRGVTDACPRVDIQSDAEN